MKVNGDYGESPTSKTIVHFIVGEPVDGVAVEIIRVLGNQVVIIVFNVCPTFKRVNSSGRVNDENSDFSVLDVRVHHVYSDGF